MPVSRAPQLSFGVSKEELTGHAGLAFLARLASFLSLPEALARLVRIKRRRRGCRDDQMLLSLIYSFCTGGGHLSDVDALAADRAACTAAGLDAVPGSRRLGEYLRRMTAAGLAGLEECARVLSRRLVPQVVRESVEQLGYVPVFVDGTGIEVSGHHCAGTRVGYNGERQYWLHSVFVGRAWVSARLNEGGGDVKGDWQQQLETDVAPLLETGTPVWVRADNAYYCRDLVAYCQRKGWDYSISVTHGRKKAPVLRKLEEIEVREDEWVDLDEDGVEQAYVVFHKPSRWAREEAYVVVRRLWDGDQRRLVPACTVILVSRYDLPLAELVRRHRGKQGQENAFKGPLTDLGLHHPPSKDYRANQAFYACGQIAQLLLRTLQYQLLPAAARRHGLQPLIRYFVRTAGRLTRSGRSWKLLFARCNYRLDWLQHAGKQLEPA